MANLRDRILNLVNQTPGLTDREITDRLLGSARGPQSINQAANALTAGGEIVRSVRGDGKIRNYPSVSAPKVHGADVSERVAHKPFSEDDLKRKVQSWLEAQGWTVNTVWGKGHGIDIEASRGVARWIIEAKGHGSRNSMRVNYFLAILGEILQRMSDPEARYSIALPDIAQFRGLWERLPQLAKSRAQISALFVSESGQVKDVR